MAFHPLDPSRGRAALGPADQRLDCVGLAPDHRLDAAVDSIAYPPVHAELDRLHLERIAKTDPLDATMDRKAYRRRGWVRTGHVTTLRACASNDNRTCPSYCRYRPD